MVAAAGVLAAPAIARARLGHAHAILAFTLYTPAGAKAPAPATIATAATWPDFSDGNLGPESTDDNLGPDSTDGSLESALISPNVIFGPWGPGGPWPYRGPGALFCMASTEIGT